MAAEPKVCARCRKRPPSEEGLRYCSSCRHEMVVRDLRHGRRGVHLRPGHRATARQN